MGKWKPYDSYVPPESLPPNLLDGLNFTVDSQDVENEVKLIEADLLVDPHTDCNCKARDPILAPDTFKAFDLPGNVLRPLQGHFPAGVLEDLHRMVDTVNQNGKRILHVMNKYVTIASSQNELYKEHKAFSQIHRQRLYGMAVQENKWKL